MQYVVVDMAEAEATALDVLYWARRYGHQEFASEMIATLAAHRYEMRCCAAAMHATYLTLAAWRVLTHGEG